MSNRLNLDGILGDDDGRRKPRRTRREQPTTVQEVPLPPAPLARMSMTVSDSQDDCRQRDRDNRGYRYVEFDDNHHALNESLHDAGWHRYMVGTMDIWMRIIPG